MTITNVKFRRRYVSINRNSSAGCIVVQTCTSQSLLAINTALVICEILGRRDLAITLIESIGSFLPQKEEAIADPKVDQKVFEPVSDFGEKRVLPITNKTVVMVKKVD